MINLDLTDQKYNQLANALVEASKGDSEEAFQQAFVDFANHIQEHVLSEAQSLVGVNDTAILSARGVRQLTSEEKTYYQKVAEAMKSSSPKQALTELDVVMPTTTINSIFDDLTVQHPLLDAIDFQNASAVTEWLLNTHGNDQLASWSPLTAEIVKEISSGFKKINLTQNKLSAYIPVAKAMLDLGPEWLDRYVRAILQEALYLGLEDGIINGRGQTLDEPIGMRKDLDGAIDQTTGYPDKAAIPFTSFNPADYGAILAQLAKTPNDRPRIVSSVIMVVNPVDYLTKVFPATTVRTTSGSYNSDVFPFPTTIIQSTRMEEGKAIMGIASQYLMVAGAGTNGGRIEFSDEYKFLEDVRVYLIKMYGHGQPKDNKSFVLLDISDLKPELLKVQVVEADAVV